MVTPDSNLSPAVLGYLSGGCKLFAGTAPTSEQPGERGTLLALGILVDFSHRQIADYQLQPSIGGRNYSVKASQSVAFGDAQFKLPLVGVQRLQQRQFGQRQKPAVHSSGRRQKASLPAMRWATTARNTSMAQQCWR